MRLLYRTLPFNIILQFIPEPTIEQILKTTLDTRRHISVGNEINRVIDAIPSPMNGFKTKSKAPLHKLTGFVLSTLKQETISSILMQLIIRGWLEANADLAETVRNAFSQYNVQALTPLEEREGFSALCIDEEFTALIQTHLLELYQIDANILALAVSVILDLVPIDRSTFEELATQQPISTFDERYAFTSNGHWEAFLAPWQILSPESVQWDSLDAFKDLLEALAQEKLAQRSIFLKVFTSELKQLQQHDSLDFFNLADALTWSTHHLNESDAQRLLPELEQLNTSLSAYMTLDGQRGETLLAERERRQTISQIEQDILTLSDRLRSALYTPTPPEPPHDNLPVEGSFSSLELQTPSLIIESLLPSEPEDDFTDLLEAVDISSGSWSDSMVDMAQTKDLADEIEVSPVPLETIVRDEPPIKSDASDMTDANEETPTFANIAAVAPIEESFWPQEIAALVLEQRQSMEGLARFFWSLLAVGDFSGAYWLARDMVYHRITPPLSSELLRVIYGTQIIRHNGDQIAADLTDAFKTATVTDGFSMQILTVVAAMRAVLIAPNSGASAWLSTTQPMMNSLRNMTAIVNDFAVYGSPVRDEHLRKQTPESIEQMVKSAADNVREKLAEAPQQRNKLQRASSVWRHLVTNGGDLYKPLKAAAENRTKELTAIRTQLSFWMEDETRLEDTIHQLDQKVNGRKPRPITGNALTQIKRDIRYLCSVGLEWCEAVESQYRIENDDTNWMMKQVEMLRSRINHELASAAEECQPYLTPETPYEQRASVYALGHLLRDLQTTLLLDTPHAWWQDLEKSSSLIFNQNFSTAPLDYQLGLRLLCLPEVYLDDEHLHPRQASLERGDITQGLLQSYLDRRTLEQSATLWQQREDYRFIETLIDTSSEQYARIERSLEGARLKLRNQLDRAKSEIERAIIDGIIAEEKRAELLSKIEAIDVASVLEFEPLTGHINDITQELNDARQKALSDLNERWHTYKREALEQIKHGENRRRIEEGLQHAFDSGDTRVIEEVLYQIGRINEDGEESIVNIFDVPQDATATGILEDFLHREENILRALEPNGLNSLWRALTEREGRFANLDIQANRMSEAFKNDVKAALNAWLGAKRGQPQSTAQRNATIQQVKAVLQFIGFTFNGDKPSDFQSGADWVSIQFNMKVSPELVRPVPQFGTLTNGRYDVVCVWDRPQADTLGALLYDQRMESRSTIVIYWGRLTPPRRRQIMQTTRDRSLPVLILDEVLLSYLVWRGIRQAAMPVFMRCTLPFSNVNPYTPYRAGDVPPEMFYGRETMALELQKDSGSCLVYGGRQLGKSALLRHVQRRFHNPAREQVAWVEDIKQIGDPLTGQHTDTLWLRLRDGLRHQELIQGKLTTQRAEDVAGQIVSLMRAKPSLRILVLFDEADNFLESDAEQGFKVVDRLRQLMADTGRRFKVVFAGLHNVQRFKDIPNQPLAHFGTALCVGPLEPTEAIKLVQEPMNAMGFNIDRETALRILSYTNYHPGLIQLFSHELLKLMLSKSTQNTELPRRIKRQDVETVYMRPEMRSGIRDRFNWTLALDKRYQAIAWALIENQISIRDGYARQYKVQEISRLVEEWWPQGFKGVEVKPLLDEMKGLGVLVEQEGLYQLRSPNLVRLIGEESIEDNLLELYRQDPPTVRLDQNHHHPLLDETTHRYSPLTYAQERMLNMQRNGVGMVFTSKMSGENILTDYVLRRFLPSELREEEKNYKQLNSLLVRHAAELETALERFKKEKPKARQSVAVYAFSDDVEPTQMEALLNKAYKFCIHNKQKDVWMRVIFIVNAPAAAAWVRLPQENRNAILRHTEIVRVAPWSLDGLKQRLEREDFNTAARELTSRVLELTGGWHTLLDRVFERFYNPKRPSADVIALKALAQQAEIITQQLTNEALYREYGFDQLPESASIVMRFIIANQGQHYTLQREMVHPEYIEHPAVPDEATCQHALILLELLNYIETQEDNVAVNNTVLKRLFA